MRNCAGSGAETCAVCHHHINELDPASAAESYALNIPAEENESTVEPTVEPSAVSTQTAKSHSADTDNTSASAVSAQTAKSHPADTDSTSATNFQDTCAIPGITLALPILYWVSASPTIRA